MRSRASVTHSTASTLASLKAAACSSCKIRAPNCPLQVMPALVFFGRRWHMASDMLPIPGICGAAVHIIWIIVFGALVGRYNILSEDCVTKTGGRQGGIQLQVRCAWVPTISSSRPCCWSSPADSMLRQAPRQAQVLQWPAECRCCFSASQQQV